MDRSDDWFWISVDDLPVGVRRLAWWIPDTYLCEILGPAVDDTLETSTREREKVARGEPSELLDILISRDWNDLMGPFTQNPPALQRPTASR